MKDKVCFISGFFPESIYNEIIESSKYNTQHAADKLQKSFLEGLHFYYPDIYVINAPFVGSYPKRYNKIKVPKKKLVPYRGMSIGFFNFMGIKQLIIERKIAKELGKWVKTLKEEKAIIIIYALIPSRIEIAIRLKKTQSNIKIIQIVPDLIQYMGSPSGYLYRLYQKNNIKKVNHIITHIDGFILLSKYMVDKLSIKDKPYVIIEGISSPVVDDSSLIDKFSPRTILYTGTLAKRYGVMNLIDAFIQLRDENLQLMICGSGDSEKEIREISKNVPNIIFKGNISHTEVIRLQKKATLLVNPRTPEGDFTKYSFPSKTIEYFQSGTPTLLYKLPGIIEEYYDYCFSIENEFSAVFLSDNIKKILSLKKEKLQEMGQKAKLFIEDTKNPIAQTEKVKKIIDKL